MEISQISKKEYWNRTKIRVFHLHHWFESLSNTCFLGCYVNRCIHVGVPTILPVPLKKAKNKLDPGLIFQVISLPILVR